MTLPVARARHLQKADVARLLGSWGVATVTLIVVVALLPGIRFTTWWAPPVAALAVGAVGFVVRPLLVSAAARIGWFAVVLVAAFGQAVVVAIALWLLPNVEADSAWSPLAAAWLAALVGSVFAWIGSAGTDEGFALALARRGRRHPTTVPDPSTEGLLVVQLDGLPYPVLQWALAAGNAPTLARWLRSGTHTLHEWRPTLPCTTPASQLGLLHGTVDGVPAFRWYDRELGRVLVANHPKDAAIIEDRAPGTGLLAGDGVSVSNLFSGGANRTAMVMSRLGAGGSRATREAVSWFVVRPDGLARSLFRTLGEVVRERAQASRQVRRGMLPRVHRGWEFAGLRAATNGVVRDLSTAVVASELLRGTHAVYVDYVDYDEVAHHAGMFRRESLAALEAVDAVLATLEKILEVAPRPYKLVVVSDHGQAQGDTFEQRTGETLHDLVRRLTTENVSGVDAPVESYSRLRALAEDLAGQGPGSRTARRTAERLDRNTATETSGNTPELVVLGSGNLGLVYVPGRRRLTLGEIDERWPDLVPGIVSSPAVGCVVASSVEGPIAIGSDGVMALRTGELKGRDPLSAYGAGARDRLLVGAERPAAPDLYVVSSCDPDTGDVHAFEELVGSHGGLGGWQDHAVLVAPASLTPPDDPVIGADALHRVLMGWRRELGHDVEAAMPTAVQP